jgi:endoglucanase
VRRSLLTALCEAPGPPGAEDRVRDIVLPELESMCDRVERDPLGGVTGIIEADGPTLMFAAHMDEIALMITHIDDRGYLRVVPLGGWDPRTLISHRITVHGRQDIPGVVGTTPVHLQDDAAKQKTPRVEDLAIDTGLAPAEVHRLVRQGDVATRSRTLEPLGRLLTGKSLDNRVGLFVAAATVQEEVGLRGAKVTATRIAPDVALAIDVCPTDDGPGGAVAAGTTRIGGGAAIRIMDASAIASRALVDLLVDIAERKDIPYQFHVANRGGTDTGSIQLAGTGAIAGCVSIPTRYIHTSVEAVHPDDIAAAITLVGGLKERAHELVV